jgi:hypothetical protein
MNELAAAWDARIEALLARLPARFGSAVTWLRQPSRRLIRFGAAVLLILGGVFSILPVLGIWMLPLGLALLAEDMPGLKPQLERVARWCERRWRSFRGKPGRPSEAPGNVLSDGSQPSNRSVPVRVRPPSGA